MLYTVFKLATSDSKSKSATTLTFTVRIPLFEVDQMLKRRILHNSQQITHGRSSKLKSKLEAKIVKGSMSKLKTEMSVVVAIGPTWSQKRAKEVRSSHLNLDLILETSSLQIRITVKRKRNWEQKMKDHCFVMFLNNG